MSDTELTEEASKRRREWQANRLPGEAGDVISSLVAIKRVSITQEECLEIIKLLSRIEGFLDAVSADRRDCVTCDIDVALTILTGSLIDAE